MLILLSRIYAAGVKRRNARFDSQRQPVVVVDVPVISVGNISAGGTGKTPVVQGIVRILQRQGKRPAVVMRGYRRTSKGIVVVHNGLELCATVEEAGDEAFLHAETLGVPVVVGEDKVEAATYAAKNLSCDVIVVDDGFQHRALHRDLDIVLIDRATLNGLMIPRGILREPLSEMRRANVILCMGDVSPDEVSALAREDALILPCEMQTEAPRSIVDSTDVLPRQANVLAVVGIAQPQRFISALAERGHSIVAQRLVRDHHRYTAADVASLIHVARASSAVIVTTEKDLVKLRTHMFVHGALQVPMYVVSLYAHIHSEAFVELLATRTTQ